MSESDKLHQALVDDLKRRRHITTPQVEAAFRAVSRHLFVPGVSLQQVYSDQVIPTKKLDGHLVSSSSQPAIMAIMLEQLGLEPGQRVLEIGAGTGYNAALMAHIVGEAGQVVTVDLDEDIVSGAQEHLAEAGYNQVQVVCADGGYGYAQAAPYDRIILTVGSADIAPAWWQQLKVSGRLVMPLGIRGDLQLSVAFERVNAHLASRSVRACGFMMLRGAFASRPTVSQVQLGSEAGLSLSVGAKCPVDAGKVYEWLIGVYADWETGLHITPYEAGFSLRLWLMFHEPCAGALLANGDMVERGLVPPLVGLGGQTKSAFTSVLLGEAGLAALMRSPNQPLQLRDPCDGLDEPPFALFVRQFGSDQSPAHCLMGHIRAWDKAGRPSAEAWRVRAYPAGSGYLAAEGEAIVEKQWVQLVLDRPKVD